jgi:hypothetical protein
MANVSINESTARGYYQVLSTDTKPTQAVQDGAKLKELDTCKWYEYSASNVNPATGDGWWQIMSEISGYGVYSGLAVVAQSTPDMTVNVEDGRVYKADGSRFVVAGNAALPIEAADTVKDRIDLVYVSNDELLAYLAGQIEIDAVAGARNLTVAVNAVADDTVTVEGETFTAVAADAGAGEFVPGGTAALTATALAAAIGANAAIIAIYTVTNPSAGVIRLVETVAGGLDTPGEATFTGTVEITNGTATASVAHVAGGTVPSTPAGGFALAEIDVDANQTTITSADITDKRAWYTQGQGKVLEDMIGDIATVVEAL